MRVENLVIAEEALEERFVGASGPGGQNVNKVATAVQLRLNLAASGLPLAVRERLARLAGSRVTDDGILIIEARRLRTQGQNRQDARSRLAALVARAAVPPRQRRPTRPSRAARQRRLDSKRQRAEKKSSRRRVDF